MLQYVKYFTFHNNLDIASGYKFYHPSVSVRRKLIVVYVVIIRVRILLITVVYYIPIPMDPCPCWKWIKLKAVKLQD